MNIYICGKAGSGKDTIADYLIKKYDYTRCKFAYPVYDIAHNYFDMKGKDRKLLNFIGTKAGREIIDTNLWVERLLEDLDIVDYTAKHLYNKEYKFVSSDTRFKNEHTLLSHAGWVGFYLDTSEEVRIQRLIARDGTAQEEMLNCESERSVDEFKDELIKVDTSGSIEQSLTNFEETLEYVRKDVIK